MNCAVRRVNCRKACIDLRSCIALPRIKKGRSAVKNRRTVSDMLAVQFCLGGMMYSARICPQRVQT